MKTIKFLIAAPAVSMIFLFGSCNSDFFTEVNTNPNSPDSVLPASLLSTVEGSIGYSQGGEYSRFSSMFTQQTLGAARQAEGWYNYIFTTQDFDTHWGNMYTQCMENNYLLIQMADEKGYHQYGGIAKILLAYSLQLVVDAWGDVPYTDAFQGLENLHPAFDNGSSVYESLNQLLDEAIDDLNQPLTESLLPGPDDFMYGGDASQWIKFAHAIKARLAIHESKTNATKAQEALDEIAQSFVGNEDNAQLFFGTTSTNAGPWNQFNTQRGDISFSTSTLAGEMSARNDPRYSILIDDAGDPDGLGLAAYYGSPNSPVEFITFDELNFIKAEAILRTSGNIEDAQAAYRDGITANMQKLGIAQGDIDAYLAANGTLPGDVNEAISQVAFQAWFALYLNPEAWTTYRRTGSPQLVAVDGTQVPRRLLYPQTEYSYNGENVPPSTLYTPRIFWDN
ncbi:MAG: SusD/RagB family nutrient-binding outer membrane lipoprotein [Chitinophagales bacterium]|nr:SusD/RagB family nutrient-binding outer membrane lipoprotein [Chitinophagales bacterium]